MIVIYCSNCGAPIDDNTKICSRCGSPIQKEPASTEHNSVAPILEKPYEPFGQSAGSYSEPEQMPNQSYNPYGAYQQPPYVNQPNYQQPYGMPYAPFGSNVPLQPYSNTLAIVSLVLSILCCNIVPGVVLSVFAITQGRKYTTAVSMGNNVDANSAAKLAKTMAWISLGLSIATIVMAVLMVALSLSTFENIYY